MSAPFPNGKDEKARTLVRSGRKPKFTEEQHEVNRQKIRNLVEIGCPIREIVASLEISQETLYRYYRKDLKEGAFRLIKAIRRKQVEVAMAGSVPMLKWLGQQFCGQTTKVDAMQVVSAEPPPRLIVEFVEPRSHELPVRTSSADDSKKEPILISGAKTAVK